MIALPGTLPSAAARTLIALTITALAACAPIAATPDGATAAPVATADGHGPPAPTNEEVTRDDSTPDSKPTEEDVPRERVTLGTETFRLERAVTGPQRARGFMERTEIPDDGGMIFVYPDSQLRSMWMANCVIDMDVIFLDRTGRILTGYAMKAEPPQRDDETQWQYEARLPRYRSIRPAQFAIELKAGTVKRLGLKAGDRIKLDLGKLKKLAK